MSSSGPCAVDNDVRVWNSEVAQKDVRRVTFSWSTMVVIPTMGSLKVVLAVR